MENQVRETSIEAYHKIKETGLLTRLRWVVYDYLFHNGPKTQRQAVQDLSNSFESNGTFSSRFAELKRMGAVKEVGKIKCDFTGKNVYLWDVTKELPKKLEKQETKAQIIARLERENAELREEIAKLKGIRPGSNLSFFDN